MLRIVVLGAGLTGEHTVGAGSIEGAVESGQRSADLVHGYLEIAAPDPNRA